MANYELSNITWKGDTYTVKDNSALHQSAIGSWTPDFANLKPLATYEYDISSTSYFKICERPNVTTITDIADEVLAFRITVTGTGIFAIADVLVRLQPTVNGAPRATINYQTMSTTAATTGIRYFRIINPKAANTSYKYELAIAAYNTTKRHIKVEVFKAPSEWIFSSAATTYSYNSTYQTATDLTLYTRIGLIGTSTHYMNTAYSDYAAYTSSWMSLFNSSNAVLVAGAAIAANQLAFVGEDYKVYPVTNTTQPILTAWPIMFVTTAIASGAACTWSYLRTWGYGTPATSVLRDTLAAHETVYLKCTYMNGKVYSQNRITPTIGVGSNSTDTYYKLGVMYNTTALAFNTLGGVYFTVDMDGNMRAINGYSLNAANASVSNAVKRQFNIVGANDYPILFDSNPTSDIATATTIPSVTPALKYNPSTGNLTSGLFTGSGAGLTDIPLDSIRGDDPVEDTDVFISRTPSLDENKYKSAKIVGGTVAFNQLAPSSVKSGTVTPNGSTTYSYKQIIANQSLANDHVYTLIIDLTYNGTKFPMRAYSQFENNYGISAQDFTEAGTKRFSWLRKISNSNSNDVTVGISNITTSDKLTSADAWSYDNAMLIDLTLMFGETIADRIYALETATAGAGVAWFKKYFPKDYYPYDTGTLVSVCPTGMASGDVSYKVSPLELNGYPSIDSNDNLVYNGDIRESNGTVTRKFRKVPITYFNGVFGATSNGYAVYRNDLGITRSNRNFLCDRFVANYNGYSTMPVMTWIGDSGATVTFTFILPSSVTSLAEANAWLASNPTNVMIPVASEFTESTYPFKSPQLVYSGETESFIDDRDVPIPVGQIAEYMDNFDAVEDAALADMGNCELLSNKVATIDSTSTDDQYPSAKAVYDIVPSKVDYSNTPFVGTCSTAAGTAAKTVNVGDGFELEDGVKVRVYMNTANSNTAPTLNVNSTGAKAIVIAGPAATSNETLSNATSGFFKRNGWFEFTYAASYGSGAGRWVMDDTYSAGRLLNTFMARPSSINSDIANGGVRYGVIASSATGNPFSATASVLWLHHDSANYTRQIAIAATIPPQMAFRAQNNGTWQPWEYVLSSANQLENHMATMAYTASAIDCTTGAVTIPIDGTEYKLLQLTVFNNDISKPLGYPSLFLFNASGTTGYKEGTTTYCTTSSTSSNISVTFDSSWNIIGSTSVDITALYRRIS